MSRMQIVAIRVKGLFGIFNHTIPLNSRGRVTIIHGPNGFGKTVILNMIAGLIEGNLGIFERIPFDEFQVDLADGSSRAIKRTQERDSQQNSIPGLEFLVVSGRGESRVTKVGFSKDVPSPVLDLVDQEVPSPYHRSGSGWIDATGTKYSLADILARFPSAGRAIPKQFRRALPDKSSLQLGVLFVETNRLRTDVSDTLGTSASRFRLANSALRHREMFSDDSSSVEHTWLKVDSNSQDLVQRIKSALADYAKHAQDRDRTFPERLVRFDREGQKPLAERALLARMNELEAKRQRLVSLGILDSESGLRDLTEDDVQRAQEALTIYVGDVEAKLRVFDDLVRRIGTLRDILNDRLPYKKLVIDREKGLRVVSDIGQPVELRDLSSGEQHELVVLYELLFRSPKKGLVLVDEPEISLHVAWQSRFLADLIDILNVTDSYAIVATHSPMIIGTNWDLTVELQGPKPLHAGVAL